MLRPRRLRSSEKLREMVHEVDLSVSQLIQPYFLTAEKKAQEPITGFTNVFRWGTDTLSKKIEADLDRGIHGFLLFGGPSEKASKDELGSAGYDANALIPNALRTLKARFGKNILLFTDVCLCPYTSHGHCGVLDGEHVANDASLPLLAKMALAHAEAGADFVAPSDMMDGRIGFIREALDEKDYGDVGILAYTAKYASSYYGPFREALSSSPKGDRATYQMDYRNRNEAMRELELDLAEGADMVMVKPALAYLDVIRAFKEMSHVPVVAYAVSGEYEMVKTLAAKGMADEKKMTLENLTAIRRAGADIIITYSASELAEKGWL